MASACARAEAVCGVVDGQTCGTCPGSSTCSSSKKTCIETVATLPFRSPVSTAIAGGRLFVTGYTSTSAQGTDLVAIELATKQVQTIAMGAVRSPLAKAGNDVLWTDAMGLRRLAPGAMVPATTAGLTSFCSDLLVDGASVYCGISGDARIGVSGLGIKKFPLAGGTATWSKTYLNNAHFTVGGGYLFYVGTTDNFSSFTNLGAVDLSDGMDQVLATGGSLSSSFILADADSFYFVQSQGGATLTRMPFTSTTGVDLLTSSVGIDRDSTVMKDGAIVTYATVGGVEGVWKVPVANPSQRSLVLDRADLRISTYGPTELLADGDGWIFITGNVVYRTIRPAL